jgi:hypothetical protein
MIVSAHYSTHVSSMLQLIKAIDILMGNVQYLNIFTVYETSSPERRLAREFSGITISRLCYDTCNAMENQRIIQSTPAIFSFRSWTTDVVITVEKVRAPNAGRRSGAPNMYWPHIWWLNPAVERGVKCDERWLYAALIIFCVDCSVA